MSPPAPLPGHELGRMDFAWEEERLVGEFDGRTEYGRALRPRRDSGGRFRGG